MVNKRSCCIGLNFTIALIGLGLIILGVVIVDVVNDAIKKGVEDKLRLEPNFADMDAEDKDDFINTELNYTYRAFDFENYDTLVPKMDDQTASYIYSVSGGAIPKIKLVSKGPWSVIEKDHKYNVSWSTDGKIVKYNSWWKKQWATPADADAEKDGDAYKYRMLNVPYLTALAGLANRTCGLAVSESNLFILIASGAWAEGRDFVTTDPRFVGAMSLGLAHVFVNNACGGSGGLSSEDCFNLWWTENDLDGDERSFNLPFWFSKTGTGAFIKASFTTAMRQTLFVHEGLGSIRGWRPGQVETNGGYSAWFFYTRYKTLGDLDQLTDPVENATFWGAKNTLLAFYKGADGFEESRLGLVAAYLGTFTGVPTDSLGMNSTYIAQRPYVKVLAQELPCQGAESFADLGYCQFATSVMTLAAPLGFREVDKHGNFNKSAVFLADPYKTICGVMDSLLGQTCRGYEIPAAGLGGTSYAANPATTLAKAKHFFEMAADLTNLTDYLGTAQWFGACVERYGGNPTACLFGDDGDAQMAFSILMARCGQPSGFPTACGGVDCRTLYDDVGAPCPTDLVNGKAFIDHISYNIPLFSMNVYITTENTGLFTKRTPADIMFGYTRNCQGSTLQCSQDANNDALLKGFGAEYKPGLLSNWSDEATNWAEFMTYHDYGRDSYYTGFNDDIAKAGRLHKYRGFNKFKRNDEVNQACTCQWTYDGCFNFTKPAVCDWWSCQDHYLQDVEFDGLSDGRAFGPFHEDDLVDEYELFFSSGYRNLRVRYAVDVEFRGIRLRRYLLEESQFKNASQSGAAPENVNIYNMKEPEGGISLQPWQRNVPVILTRPHFWEGDEYYLRPFTADSDIHKDRDGSDSDPEGVFQSYVDIEPLTGLTMRAHRRLQYVVKLEEKVYNNPTYKRLFEYAGGDPANGGNITRVDPKYGSGQITNKIIYFPAFWADEWGEIKPEDANDFVDAVYGNRDKAEVIEITGYTVGSFCLVIGILGMAYWLRQETDDTLLKLESRATL